MPQSPYFHRVGGAAGKDKNPKQDKHPMKWKIPALADKINQGEGYGKIRQGDQDVGSNMQTDKATVPQVTVTMRHVRAGGQKCFQELHRGSRGI
jgi:hypothetical protein